MFQNQIYPFDGIEIIKKSGGLAFLAHPKLIGLEEEDFVRLVKDMKNHGLDGIETYYSLFSKEDMKYFEKIAEKFSLIRSAGSDFHGENRKGVDIGDNYAPKELFYIWNELYEQKKQTLVLWIKLSGSLYQTKGRIPNLPFLTK